MSGASSVRRILLWRHGQTPWNVQSRFQGHVDIDLDDVGRAQAIRAAGLLAQLEPAAIVSSDLQRAQDTAAQLSSVTGLPVVLDPRLRETYAGAWQGLTGAEIDAKFGDERTRWRTGLPVRPGGDGELRTEVGARMAASLNEHAAALPPGGLLVACTHGGAVSSGLQALLGIPPKHWPVVSGVGNCHWSLVEERMDGGWILAEHDASSLPIEVLGDES